MWYYNRVLRQELQPLIEAQLQQVDEDLRGPKTISNLALRAHRKESGGSAATKRELDREFVDVTVEQMKIFLFAGHDTTSSTLCFTFAELHNHPEVLRTLRAEHDSVFGPDPSMAAQRICENPVLLNQLPYSVAVLKEILRLYVPFGTVREGSPTFYLSHPKVTGQRLPTDGFMLFDGNLTLHRNPYVWPNPDDFIPDRWLNGQADKIGKNAFRAFEQGPRNCIGQELAMTELKMLLVLTVRDFDIVPMYDDSDPSVFGNQAFQAQMPGELTAHPSRGLPVKVKVRTQHQH